MAKNSGQFKKGQHWREHVVFREKDWLIENYVLKKRSAGEIAAEFSVTDAAILFWLRKHGIQRRTVSEARGFKHWGLSGSDNPMWNRLGELNPRWLGGVTAERQAFYASQEWKSVCREVWKRDKATCQRCGLVRDTDLGIPFHIHHVTSFVVKALRAEASNLLLVCEPCHQWIHSRRNVNREYLQEI